MVLGRGRIERDPELGEVRHAGGVYRRLGPPNPPRGSSAPRVDFEERDHQDASDYVDEETVRRDYAGSAADRVDVYRAYVESSDVPAARLAEDVLDHRLNTRTVRMGACRSWAAAKANDSLGLFAKGLKSPLTKEHNF